MHERCLAQHLVEKKCSIIFRYNCYSPGWRREQDSGSSWQCGGRWERVTLGKREVSGSGLVLLSTF